MRRLLFWVLVLELAAVLLFLAVLVRGEHGRASLIAMYLPRLPLLLATVGGAALAPLTRRRVRPLVAAHLVVALVVLFPVMGFHVNTARTLARPVHLATWNVFFGRVGRAELVDDIVALPADVIVLQAAYDSLGKVLTARLPDRHVAQRSELVVVSKLPLRVLDEPPSLDDGQPAMFDAYVVETPTGPLGIYCMHPFSPRHAMFDNDDPEGDIAHRDAQVGRVVAAARASGLPFVLAGDTNLPQLSRITKHFEGLTDAFADVGTGFGFTFPVGKRFLRLDRVLGSDRIRFGAIQVAPAGPSDHHAVLVDLEISDR